METKQLSQELVEACKELAFRISCMSASMESTEEYDEKLFDHMQSFIAHLNKQCNARMIEVYTSTLNSFKRFRKDEDIMFSHITGTLMEEYECYLKGTGITMNTISFYMRTLKAVYNRAVNLGITHDREPFRKVYTSIARTTKRAIGVEDMRRIKSLEIEQDDVRFARDMFMFSFYTQGMSFVDMAYLKPSDLTGNSLVYRRKKTGQELTVRWSEQAQEIIDRYPPCNDKYMLPIIKKPGVNERNQYRYKQYAVNCGLKQVSEALQMGKILTMYVARHSWASIARAMDVPTETISRGMGHTSEKTTKIYLKSLGSASIDNANIKVISAL